MTDWVTRYWEEIEAGREIVSKKVYAIYKRLAAEIAADEGPWAYDVRLANKPIEFCRRFCRHSKGEWAGKPLELELWQRAATAAMFGFVDRETGVRRYREAAIFCARKCGKSTWMCGLLLYLDLEEPGAECYIAATKFAQANRLIEECRAMIDQSPELSRLYRKRKDDLYCAETRSIIKAVSRNASSQDGLNSNGIVVDELHGILDRSLYEVLITSMSARRQPLLIMTSTAGTVRGSIFDDVYELCEKVIDGTADEPRFLPICYEIDDVSKWDDETEWRRANPALGTIKKLEDMRTKAARVANSPVDKSNFLTKDLNVRGTSSSAWLTFPEIDNPATYEPAELAGRFGIGGADLSITTDLTAACVLVGDGKGGYYVAPMFWIPEDTVEEHVRRDKIPYDVWHERGIVRFCKGNVIDPHDVTLWFLEIVQQWDVSILAVGYDPYSARYWTKEMEDLGFQMERVRQGHQSLSLPMQTIGQDLRAKRVNYNSNPCLKWNLTNTGVDVSRNGTIAPIKAQKPRQRIDGTVALACAYKVLLDNFNDFNALNE